MSFDFDEMSVGIDFTDEVLGLVQRLKSHAEVSSPGNVLREIAEDEMLDDSNTEGDLRKGVDEVHLGVYDTDRYSTLTRGVYNVFKSVETEYTC